MGMAAGFQSGIALGKAFKEGQERRRIEGIRTAAPETSQGYTAEQGQQLEAMASAINPETGRPYYNVQAGEGGNYTVTPDFTEAQIPRTGMGTDVVGIDRTQLQPAAFNQQRVTDFLGRRFEGELTPDRIEAMRSRAMAEGLSDPRQRLAAIAEATRLEREAEEAPLRRQALETQVEAGKLGLKKSALDIESGTLTLEQQKRVADELQRGSDFAAFAAERPDMPVAELKDAAFKQFKFTPKQWQETVATRLQIETGEMDIFKKSIAKKLQGKNLTQLGSLYNSDPDFDDKTDLAIVPGKGGAVTLNFIDKATKRITGTQTFKNEALATEYLNKQATEPETIGTWMMNLQKTQSGIDAQGAATEASRATVGLRNAQMKQIQAGGQNAEERAGIVDKFQALTEEEQAGPKGQGLIKQFNLLNAKAGGMVPLGTTPKAATGPARELSDLDKENLRYYRDWVKDPKNAKLPQGQKDAFAAELGVTPFIKRDTAGPESGLGANVYAAPQQGVNTTRPSAAAAPAAPAPAALTTENTKLLNRAGNTGYNVQLPDGTTRVMSISELNRVGYQFPGGTGLQRAWYEDLLPR